LVDVEDREALRFTDLALSALDDFLNPHDALETYTAFALADLTADGQRLTVGQEVRITKASGGQDSFVVARVWGLSQIVEYLTVSLDYDMILS